MNHILYFIKKLHKFAGWMLYFNLFGMVLVSLLEGMGVFLLIPMLNSSGIVNIGASSISLILESLPFHLNLPLILSLYVLLIVCQAMLQKSVTVRNAKVQISFVNSLRLELYRSLLQANWSFFFKKRKSDLVNTLTNEIGRVSLGTNLTLQLATSFVFTSIQIALALWLSVKLTLSIIICGLVLTFLSRKFLEKAKSLGNQSSEISKSYLGAITDHFSGIKDIKSNSLEGPQYNWMENWSEKVEHEQLEYFKLKMTSQFYYKVSLGIFLAVFIVLSIKVFRASPEQLLLVIFIFSRLWPRFINIQSNLEQIASTIPAFKKLIYLQKECEEYKEIDGQEFTRVKSLEVNKEIECKGVFFRYNQSESQYILQDVNLKIPANSITAITGPSGAGKSTLIDLIMGLLQPEKGQIIIDGAPLTNGNLLSFRKSIGYVHQEPFLFNGSIRDNLKMVVPNATEEEIWEALEISSAAEFVKKLPRGLETVVGDRGSMLSGGERQRLVLARVILKKPCVLILDEATSALDNKNVEKIYEALMRMKEKTTILVVSHDLSMVNIVNKLIVLEKKKILQT